MLQPRCEAAIGFVDKPREVGVLPYVAGYGGMFRAFVYGLCHIGCGGCGNGSYGSLCGSADEGAEEAVGKGVEPCVHVYHVAVYHARVGGVDADASLRQPVGHVGREQGDGQFRAGVIFEACVVCCGGIEKVFVYRAYMACHGGGEYDVAPLCHGREEQPGEQVCAHEIDTYGGFVSVACEGKVLAHDAGVVDEGFHRDAVVVYAAGKSGYAVE